MTAVDATMQFNSDIVLAFFVFVLAVQMSGIGKIRSAMQSCDRLASCHNRPFSDPTGGAEATDGGEGPAAHAVALQPVDGPARAVDARAMGQIEEYPGLCGVPFEDSE